MARSIEKDNLQDIRKFIKHVTDFEVRNNMH
jgi:hypothetical protein